MTGRLRGLLKGAVGPRANDSRYLLDVAGQLETGTAEFRFADPGSPTLIQDVGEANALYVLMPMRV